MQYLQTYRSIDGSRLAARKKRINIEGYVVEVERERIKNVDCTIYPPDGRVHVTAPAGLSEKTFYEAIEAKLA
jgi:hypothetical protein